MHGICCPFRFLNVSYDIKFLTIVILSCLRRLGLKLVCDF